MLLSIGGHPSKRAESAHILSWFGEENFPKVARGPSGAPLALFQQANQDPEVEALQVPAF